MPEPDETASSFSAILAAELDEIKKRRAVRDVDLADKATPSSELHRPEEIFPRRKAIKSLTAPLPPTASKNSIQEANRHSLLGLAFSGGGIRSATFNLGVLQALAKRNLLHRFDYLSTISGGGYIGAWLAAWIYRRGLREVETRLGAERKDQPRFKEPPEISFLREYSNYLTPRKGFLGADTWTAISIYCRNLILNQLVLILFIAAILLAPRALTAFAEHPAHWLAVYQWKPGVACLLVFALLGIVVLLRNMRDYTINPRPNRVLASVTSDITDSNEVEVKFFPSETEDLFTKLLESSPKVEIWDRTITCRKDVVSLRRMCGFTRNPDNRGKMRFTKPVSANVNDLVIAVFPAMDQAKLIIPLAAIPLFFGSIILSCLVAHYGRHAGASVFTNLASPLWWVVAGAINYTVLWGCVFFINRNLDAAEDGTLRRWLSNGSMLISPFIAGATGGLLLWKLAPCLQRWVAHDAGMWKVLGFGAPIVTLILLATSVLQIGLLGVVFSEARREWWGRLAAILLITCFMWLAAFALAGWSPLLLLWLFHFPKSSWLVAIGWAATTVAGILGGKSANSSGLDNNKWKDAALSVTPYVFIVGLLMLVSLGIHATLMKTIHEPIAQSTPEKTAIEVSGSGEKSLQQLGNATIQLKITQRQTSSILAEPYWKNVEKTLTPWVYYAFLICLAASFLLALRVDLNEFSMHYLYRNRLVRCYLGASHRDRVPNPFTGFDVNDDLHLSEFTMANDYDGPLPIFGAALNLVHGKDLAWQERKAESFVMTPLFCGFDVWFERLSRPGQWDKPGLEAFGYRRTQNYAYPKGFFVGTAMAISGAAASPNMGYHSSPALGFLMTVFNVRLGWWVGNPRHTKSWRNAGPLVGLGYLLAELFGATDDSGKYVYLSDGGHFENLGIYELVKRRCRFILACDAGADKDLKFGDLASAIRKCRSDMGIDIKLRTDRLVAMGTPAFSKWHCAVGEILYKDSDPGAGIENGVLLYIKSSLTSDEPADVLNYKAQYPDFPHQSTADQWFTESQFEGYRALGEHVIESVLCGLPADLKGSLAGVPTADLFSKLDAFWKNSYEIQAVRWPPYAGL
jgi:hypothetical protein